MSTALATYSGWDLTATERPPSAARVNDSVAELYRQVPFMPPLLEFERIECEQMVRKIGELVANWDGLGALPVPAEAVECALDLLRLIPEPPTDTYAFSPGTLGMEWLGFGGSAHLEIGRTSFSFYTSPIVGRSILMDGRTGELDVQQLWQALATVLEEPSWIPMAVSDWALGHEVWQGTRAA